MPSSSPDKSSGLLLFHVEHLLAAVEYAGIDVTPPLIDTLTTYAEWLAEEGVRSGGIGPGEVDRLASRHLADSALFASLIPTTTKIVWDLGTGVGLPGVPLAVLQPEIEFVLIDRSGRRTDLLRRVVRILDLPNCQVIKGEIADLSGFVETIVSRASLPPDDLRPICLRHLTRDGVAVAGGSWQRRPEHRGWETVEIPHDVLDHTIWLLMMRQA